MSLLIGLLNELRPAEKKKLRHWLNAPLHNNKPELLRLFDYLITTPGVIKLPLNEKTAYESAYPDIAYTPKRWDKLAYLLLNSIEAFIAHQRFGRDQLAQRTELLSFYRERGLYDHLQTRINRYSSRYPSNSTTAGHKRFYHDHRLKKEAYFLSTVVRRSPKHNLLDQEQSLLMVIMADKFRQACETQAHLRLFPQRGYRIPLLEELLELYAAEPRPDLPGVHLFYLATQLYRSEGAIFDEIFQELKSGLEIYIEEFPQEDRRNLLILTANHGVRQLNTGRRQYLRLSLDIYQLGLEKKALYENGQISIYTFNNILAIAFRLGEADWAEFFLEQNVRRLPDEKRAEVESLSRARLTFLRGDFDQTLQHLRTADYQDIIHHLTARVIRMKIYFLRGDYNLFASHVQATKSWLRRKKKLGYHQRNYLNIFTLAEKVQKLPLGDKPAREALKKKIEATEPCTEKPWLLSVIGS